jgi:hypothetical protein
MKINNKIPWALVVGMLGTTMTGIFNGAMIMGIASVTLGDSAMMIALLTDREEKTQTRIGNGVKVVFKFEIFLIILSNFFIFIHS